MARRAEPQAGEYWVVHLESPKDAQEIVFVSGLNVYPCGDEQGWPIDKVKVWVRKIRL